MIWNKTAVEKETQALVLEDQKLPGRAEGGMQTPGNFPIVQVVYAHCEQMIIFVTTYWAQLGRLFTDTEMASAGEV